VLEACNRFDPSCGAIAPAGSGWTAADTDNLGDSRRCSKRSLWL
jgi:hypothetical protein